MEPSYFFRLTLSNCLLDQYFVRLTFAGFVALFAANLRFEVGHLMFGDSRFSEQVWNLCSGLQRKTDEHAVDSGIAP